VRLNLPHENNNLEYDSHSSEAQFLKSPSLQYSQPSNHFSCMVWELMVIHEDCKLENYGNIELLREANHILNYYPTT
jgi:hypothetical protein